MSSRGIMKGDTILLGWCGCEDSYIVKVESIDSGGVRGTYASWDRVGHKPTGPITNVPYNFLWDMVVGIRKSPVELDSRPEKRVKLNDEHTAVISRDKQTVTVGCQKFSRASVIKLAAALE